ncbi:vitamin D3 hydroxylase-associated protein-like isoform 2-T2 [Rhinophrynus dorsalis]
MLHEKVIRLLSEYEVETKILGTVGCCIAMSLYFLRWIKKRRIFKKMEQERQRRDSNLQLMEETVAKFIKQNPGEDPSTILNMSLVELTDKLRDGSLSPESVLYSYIGKALEVTRNVNCVTMFMSDCETQLQVVKKQEKRGLLYGIPISIKEHIGYQGYPSTCGLVQYLDEFEKEDSVIVKVLKKQGAIVFAKTNVPQTLICFETSNPIYGHTCNPLNPTKGASGSSGGEGALIGAGGSILGVGTDLGGSIRLPSSFCGIAGFKPTAVRLSVQGVRQCIDGMNSVPLCIGPMARDVDSLALFMKALLCDEMFQLDLTVPPLPFKDEVYSSSEPLRIGYYDTDGFTFPSPGMRRVLLETKKLLEEAGHTLIPFTPPRIQYMVNEIFIKTIFADGGKTLRDKFKNNIIDPNLREQFITCNLPGMLKKMLSFILRPLVPRIANSLNSLQGASSVKDAWKQNIAMQEYQTEFINEWRKLNLDVMLCPMLGPAFNIGYPGKLLGFPAGVVPVSIVTQADEEELKHYKGYYNDHWDKLFKKAVEGGLGLPLSVQCAALPYQDELCLRLMKEVETLNQNKK